MSVEDKEFEAYYNTMMDLFGSEGWKILLKDLEVNGHNINSVEATKDSNDLYFRKGQLTILANLLGLESQLVTLREQRDTEAEVVDAE